MIPLALGSMVPTSVSYALVIVNDPDLCSVALIARTAQGAPVHDPERADVASSGLPADVADSPLFNPDLAPVPQARRNWSTYNYAALWISMAHCIPTYMLAGGLVAVGMNWWQALLTIGLGNLIVLVPILLNAHPGTKYGIPFPVLARSSFGTIGANIPAVLRAIVACGWFGIQTPQCVPGRQLRRRRHDADCRQRAHGDGVDGAALCAGRGPRRRHHLLRGLVRGHQSQLHDQGPVHRPRIVTATTYRYQKVGW